MNGTLHWQHTMIGIKKFSLINLMIGVMIFQYFRPSIAKRKQQALLIDKIEDCVNSKPSYAQFNASSVVSVDKQTTSFEAFINVHRDFPSNIQGSWKIKTCTDNTFVDCEYYGNFKQNNYCEFVKKPGGLDAWNVFYKGYQPPVTCPLKKGIYKNKNYTISGKMKDIILLQFHLNDKSFVSELATRAEDGRLLMCVRAYVKNALIST